MESSLKCEVCFVEYNSNEHRPKSLPCGHTICASCIKVNLRVSKGKMNCPFCRTTCGTGVKILDDFPTTFALLNLIYRSDQNSPSKTLFPREKEKEKEILQQKKQAEHDRAGSHISNCNKHLISLLHEKEMQESAIHSIRVGKNKLLEDLKKLDEEEKKVTSRKNQLDDIIAEGNDIVKSLEGLQDRVKLASSLPGLNMASQDVQRYDTASQEWVTSRVKSIIKGDSPLTNEGLVEAVMAGDPSGVTRALQQGEDPNTTCTFTTLKGTFLKAAPVLVCAVAHDDADVVKVLIETKSIKIDFRGDAKNTPLFNATIKGKSNIVQLLLSRGANPNLVSGDPSGPPLIAAALAGHLNICRLLLQYGAKPNITYCKGMHSIYLAAQGGHRDIVKLIIENGGDPQLKVKGFTAADNARFNGYDDLADWLQKQRKVTRH